METEELPPGWAWATLGGVLPLEYGNALPERIRDKAGKIPVYGSAGKVGVHNTALVKGPTIIVGRKGSAGAVFYEKGDCWPIDTAYAARISGAVDPRFGYHFLTYSNLRKLDQSTAIPSLSRQSYSSVIMPIPPKREQFRIATTVDVLFDQLDEAEAALGRARVGVERFRASLLHAACTGQLTTAWRAANPAAETGADLLRRILTERRAAWERTERARLEAKGTPPRGDAWKARYVEPVAPDLTDMPDLPEGWVWASLDQLARSSSYGSSVKCDANADGVAVLRIPNVQTGTANWSNLKYATTELGLGASDLLAVGDLLIVRTNGSPNLVGRAGLVDAPPKIPSYFASYLIRFRLAEPTKLQQWIASAFGSGLVRMQVGRFAATSAGQYNISQTNLAAFAIPLPPPDEMAVAMDLLQESPLQVDELPNDSAIGTLRQSILHAAFTGRLVPQDPSDEPAAALLARLHATPAQTSRARRRTPAKASA